MDHTNPHHERRWLILAVLGIAQLMVILDATIVNVALPSAQQALGFSDGNRQWIVTAYALAFGSLLLLGGRLGDLFGRKRMFITGLIGFAGASALGGAAQSFELLVAARALQGLFGALLAPSVLSLLTTIFTNPKERAQAFTIYGAIAGAGGALGLLLGGVLTEYLSWRWALYVNLAFAVPAALAAQALLHNQVGERPKLDIPGTLTATTGLFALVYGFSKAETAGWGAGVTLGFLGAGVALIAAFVAIQRRSAGPLLPLRVLADRNRAGSYLAIGIAGAGMFGVFLFLTYFLQQTLGYSPVKTGLAFLPMTAAIMVSAGLGNTVLLTRVSPRILVPLGLVVSAVAMAMLTRIDVQSSYASTILPPLLVMAVGLGLVFAPCFSLGTLGIAPHDAGVASATVNVSQQIGGSIGTALLNTIATSAAIGYVTSHTSGSPTPAVLAQAAVHSYRVSFWIGAAIFIVAALIVGPLLRPGIPDLGANEEFDTYPVHA
jgi:EmrB/QacA subfamily drug resistance transporter